MRRARPTPEVARRLPARALSSSRSHRYTYVQVDSNQECKKPVCLGYYTPHVYVMLYHVHVHHTGLPQPAMGQSVPGTAVRSTPDNTSSSTTRQSFASVSPARRPSPQQHVVVAAADEHDTSIERESSPAGQRYVVIVVVCLSPSAASVLSMSYIIIES